MIVYKVCTYERVEVSRHVDVDNCFLHLSPNNTGGPGGPAHLDRLFGTLVLGTKTRKTEAVFKGIKDVLPSNFAEQIERACRP